MSKLQFCVKGISESAREWLPVGEKWFNCAGYIPFVVHRVSGGTRMVFGSALIVASVASAGFVGICAAYQRDEELQSHAWKLLDFAVHGGANVVRGFIVAHKVGCLFFIIHDLFVPENKRLVYDRPIFKG